MSWDNTPITYRDVIQWKYDFQSAKTVIDHMEENIIGDAAYIKQRMDDALFLKQRIDQVNILIILVILGFLWWL